MSPYIKKILVAIALIGIVLGFILTYKIYTVIFSPNTSFNNEKAYIYIKTGATFSAVKEQLAPCLKMRVPLRPWHKKKDTPTTLKRENMPSAKK